MTPQRREPALARLLARHAAMQRLLPDLDLRVLSAQHAAHRTIVIVDFKPPEVSGLTAAAGADDVAGDLIEVPDLVRETDGTPPRGAIAVATIGHADRHRGGDAAPE